MNDPLFYQAKIGLKKSFITWVYTVSIKLQEPQGWNGYVFATRIRCELIWRVWFVYKIATA